MQLKELMEKRFILKFSLDYATVVARVNQPMSSKSPRFGWLIAIFKEIDDYIAVNKNDYFVEVFTNQDLLKQKTETKFPKSTILSR